MRKGGLKSRSRKPQQPDDIVLGGARRSENNDAFLHTETHGYTGNNGKHGASASGGGGGAGPTSGTSGMGGGNGGGGGSNRDPQPSPTQQQQQQPQQGGRRRANTDEMALSQKNHRLAKELSELRVRHREETKVVSRLTMENMNLASRCREAIAHVAMLKKDKMSYQRRQSEWQIQMQQLQAQQQQVMHVVGNKQQQQQSGSEGERSQSLANERNVAGEPAGSVSPHTDLDRIMSEHLKKADTIGNTAPSVRSVVATEKKDSLTKQFKEQTMSSSSASAAGSNKSSQPLPTGGAKRLPPNGQISAVSSFNSNSIGSDSTSPGSKNGTGGSAIGAHQKDDEFDLDFFARSQGIPAGPSAGESPASVNRAHARNGKSTDDRMPAGVVSPPTFSPKVGQGEELDDTLLNSLDAFEASFESAFPEQPFSMTSDAPTSPSLQMAFDVPDFGDPFFKSSGGNDSVGGGQSLRDVKGGGSNHSVNLESLRVSTGGSTSFGGTGAVGGGKMKSELQDLFPESAMGFKAGPVQNPLFDSPAATTNMGMMGSASERGRIAPVAPEKSETIAMRAAHYEMALNRDVKSKPAASSGKDGLGHNKHFFEGSGSSSSPHQKPIYRKPHSDGMSLDRRGISIRSASAPLSPGSMSAEIQQLDAIASNIASGDVAGASPNGIPATAANRNRKVRNVKQPISYAEPTINSKLRRGDVIFPKVDPAKKHPLSGAVDTSRCGSSSPSPMNGKNPEEVLKDLEIPL